MTEIEELKKLYIFDNEKEIVDFLKENDFLLNVLFEAPEQVKKYFGEDVKIHLELFYDPESCYDELFIVIENGYSAEMSCEIENKLVNEWFLDKMKELKGKLNITNLYIPKR